MLRLPELAIDTLEPATCMPAAAACVALRLADAAGDGTARPSEPHPVLLVRMLTGAADAGCAGGGGGGGGA
jgi:hypothetical protein